MDAQTTNLSPSYLPLLNIVSPMRYGISESNIATSSWAANNLYLTGLKIRIKKFLLMADSG